ncbi:MAG: TRAP transporter large permease subunit [Pontiella sp.]
MCRGNNGQAIFRNDKGRRLFLSTPPVGTCLFIGCGVGKTTIAKVTPTMLPFFGAMIIALMVITYIPAVSLWLPVQTKQLKKADVEKSAFMQVQPSPP